MNSGRYQFLSRTESVLVWDELQLCVLEMRIHHNGQISLYQNHTFKGVLDTDGDPKRVQELVVLARKQFPFKPTLTLVGE